MKIAFAVYTVKEKNEVRKKLALAKLIRNLGPQQVHPLVETVKLLPGHGFEFVARTPGVRVHDPLPFRMISYDEIHMAGNEPKYGRPLCNGLLNIAFRPARLR